MPVDPAHRGPGVTHRLPAVFACTVMVLATVACGSGSGGSGSGGSGSAQGSTASTLPPTPFLGTFVTAALPAGVQELGDVACPSTTRCWAVGSTLGTAHAPSTATVVTTTDGGATWTVQPVPPTVGYLTGIACATTRSCTAVGQVGAGGAGPGAVLTTQNAGTTWVLQAVPAGTTDVTAVACPPAGRCLALADVTGRVTALSPGAPGSAWVAGGALAAPVSAATGLACTDARHCWATVTDPVDVGHASGGVAATTDGGATWVLETVPGGTGLLRGIDCTPLAGPSSSTPGSTSGAGSPRVACAAVGTTATAFATTRAGQGLVLTTITGGASWTQSAVTSTVADLLAVSCGAGPCAAVGTTVAATPQAGVVVLAGSSMAGPSGWRRAAVADVPLPLSGVSCRSLSSCVAVGESVSAHLAAG